MQVATPQQMPMLTTLSLLYQWHLADSRCIMKQTDLQGEHLGTDFSTKLDHTVAKMDIFYSVTEDN